ncbi:MAG TPA: sulfite exporter TauE/SafE family protein [Chitinophagales bacterium]|nr:sulfite exporter TauE/SafE family protein [Chitinophagales bacterium]
MEIILFYVLLFAVAFLYASVGHGGASGYLALMALFAFVPEVMRPTALVLNIFVASVGAYQYFKHGHFNWKLLWPFTIASVPASFIGGLITLDADLYKKILGVFLLIAIIRMIYSIQIKDKELKRIPILFALIIGVVIGILSGMIGIGGGIILSPIILLMGWGNMKQTAAVSAMFILVNSISGLSGQLISGVTFSSNMWWMVVIAFAGGATGAYFGARHAKPKILSYLLSVVLLIAALKLLFGV